MLYVSLRQYEYLVSVARTGSLTEAARRLNVSQPSLSVAIRRTEERLGRRLFVHGRGGPLRPTPEGRAFVARAEALLAQAARLEDPAFDTAERRRACIGFSDDLAPRWLAPTLTALAREPLVLFDDGLSIQHVLRLFTGQGLPHPRVVHRAASVELMRSLAAHGQGVGVSYTDVPYATSQDGTPIASVRIADRVAIEPVVLAWPAQAGAGADAAADASLSPARIGEVIGGLSRPRPDGGVTGPTMRGAP